MSTNDRDIAAMEEGRAEPIGGDEISRGNGQITEHLNEMINEHTENTGIPSRKDRIKQRLKSFDDVLTFDMNSFQKQARAPKIPRVPTRLRENENLKEYFEPRVVSIGPYYHRKKKFKVTEERKLKLASMFFKRNFVVAKEDLYFKIITEIEALRECYELDATKEYDDDDLAWIFFIDGCVVLHFLTFGTYKIDGDVIDRKTLDMDLILLENQLPFRVLKLLISSSKDEEWLINSIQWFIRSKTRILVQENQKQPLANHLLDLMLKSYLKEFVRDNEKSNFVVQIFKKLSGFLSYLFSSIKFLLYRIFLRLILFLLDRIFLCPILRTETTQSVDVQTIQELTEFGIGLKPAKTSRLTDITFSHGTLKIPRIRVDDSTAFKFLNLIAYETALNYPTRVEVSSYIFFLTSLITQEEDVKELRVNRILFNNLNSNKDVVKLFQKISTADFPERSRRLHSSLLKDMQKHCEKKHNVWRGQFKRRYFGSPWSLIAAVGAVTILILTLLQTIYTVLGYHTEHTTKTSSNNG